MKSQISTSDVIQYNYKRPLIIDISYLSDVQRYNNQRAKTIKLVLIFNLKVK